MAATCNFSYWLIISFTDMSCASIIELESDCHSGYSCFSDLCPNCTLQLQSPTWLEHRVWCARLFGWTLMSLCRSTAIIWRLQVYKGKTTLTWLLLRTADRVVSGFLVPFAPYTASHSLHYRIKWQSHMHMPICQICIRLHCCSNA